jgi:uncharacterized protein
MSEPLDIKILSPGANWMRIGALVALGMDGYYSKLPKGSTVAAVTSDPGPTCTDAPRLVAEGKYHMGITTPIFYGEMAGAGKGLFDEKLPLRALAAFPHDDRLVMAVRKETGITSLAELVDRRPPLKVSTPPLESRHPACVIADEVLKAYGASFAQIESWGGTVLRDRPRDQNASTVPVDPSFDAIFDEAIMTNRWQRIFTQYDMHVLPIDEDVLSDFEKQGYWRGEIKAGRLPGLDHNVPTLDFTGWLLFCREDLPDEIAYIAIEALEEQHKNIEGMFKPGSGLTGPIEMNHICRNTGLSLHPGAERFYREHGYLN